MKRQKCTFKPLSANSKNQACLNHSEQREVVYTPFRINHLRIIACHVLIVLFLMSFYDVSAKSRIVILGSSTAAGSGASSPNHAWVNLLKNHMESFDPANEVINLALGGYTTYHLMPTENKPRLGRPEPDVERNITKALSLAPQAIIINLPSNDVSNRFSQDEILANYIAILEKAAEANIPVWVTTTQPRNFPLEEQRELQFLIYQETLDRLGDKAIDCWSLLATPDHKLNSKYDVGDGIHLNDLGHHKLFNQIAKKRIMLPKSKQ